jgi:hypothetical protein
VNKFFMLLTLTLLVALACGSQVSAGIIPGLDNPTTGGVGENDGDHPWGGDRAPVEDLVLTNTGSSTFTHVTGIPVIDVLVNIWITSTTTTTTSDAITTREVTAVTGTRSARTSTVSSSSFRGRKALR